MIALSPKVRLYIYKVLVAAGPLVLLAGWATSSELALWIGLAYTVLGSPVGALAAANVPTVDAPGQHAAPEDDA